jgi:hypothetical protein
VSAPAVRRASAFEDRLARFLFERSEEARAIRVGEKEESEQAAIVARYADLFTRPQLDALRDEEFDADGLERERLARLVLTCEAGIVVAELAEQEDALENALLAARVEWQGDELPLRAAQAKLAVLDDYAERDELGERQRTVSAGFNEERRALLTAREALEADLTGEPDPVRRSEVEKRIALDPLLAALEAVSQKTTPVWEGLRSRWFDRLLGAARDDVPTSSHTAYMRRLSPLAGTYTKERSAPVCAATLGRLGFDLEQTPGIRLDLDDRPQKSPRACVIASDPPTIVHLITRAQGGLHDYQAFLHEAGHALHYAGCDPTLPYTFRRLSRDHGLTEIYSYIVEAVSREPGWHAEHFGLSDDEARANAESTTFLEALLFRRYTAKLGFELDFWGRFGRDGGTDDGYEERLTSATGIRYAPSQYLSDMDAGFYSADYLRAWIRSAQLQARLRAEVGEDWWRKRETGERLRALFWEGTTPTSEDVAESIGFDPLDTGPLEAELTATSAG